MALIRLFAVRLAATRPCVAVAGSGTFATRAPFAGLPPTIRRAFTQSRHARYPEKTPQDRQHITKLTTPSTSRPQSSPSVPEPMVKTTPPAPPASTPEPPPIGNSPNENLLPEVLLIYSPGQARIVYIAFWKVTSLLLGVTCTASMIPSLAAGTIGISSIFVVACSFIPFALMNYIARPFVTYMFLRLPPYACVSREHLERFIQRRPPPDTRLRIMTLGLVVKPRITDVTLAELKPAPGRYGLVDYARDVRPLMARRRWYEYLPISEFGIADSGHATVKDAWAWNIIRPLLGKTAAKRNAPWKPLE